MRTWPQLTPAEKRELADWLKELLEVREHRGRHQGHTLTKTGKCVTCSCGFRYQR